MVDVTEQLSQYATRLGDRTAPVELDEIDSTVRERGEAAVSTLELHPASSERKGRRPAVLAVAAVALVAVVSVGAFLATRDDPTDVVTEPGPSEDAVRPDPSSPTFGYEPGWTELDSGPLEPRQGAATVWTGTELIVVGGTNHTDGAAYDPRTGTWRTIAEPPVPVGGAMLPTAVWTGDEALILRRNLDEGMPAPPGFVAYDPSADSWRLLADPPPVTGPHSLLWAGSEAILPGASATYDPGTDTWRQIDLGPGGGEAAVAWTGDRLVMASSGSATVIYDPETGETEERDPVPDRGLGLRGGSLGGAVALDGEIVIVDEGGWASRLDLSTGTWHEEDDLRNSQSPCIQVGWPMADGSSVWDLCETMWFRTADGEWSDLGPSKLGCCMRGTVGTGAALLAWISNDDALNDPTAPHKELWVWVPPEGSATGTTDPPADPPTGPPPDPMDSTYGYEPGWHDLNPGPMDAEPWSPAVWTGSELIVLGGTNRIEGASYTPQSGEWRQIADSPFDPQWAVSPRAVWTGSELIVVRPYPELGEGSPRQVAAYEPWTDTWRSLPDAPPYAGGPAEMVWTGSEEWRSTAAWSSWTIRAARRASTSPPARGKQRRS